MVTEFIIARERENSRLTGIICSVFGGLIFSFYLIPLVVGAISLDWFGWFYLSFSGLLTLLFLKLAIFAENYEMGIRKVHGDRFQLYWNDAGCCKGMVPLGNVVEIILTTSENVDWGRYGDDFGSLSYRISIKLKNGEVIQIPHSNISQHMVLKKASPVIRELQKRVTLTYVTEKVGDTVKDKEKKPIIEQYGVAPGGD